MTCFLILPTGFKAAYDGQQNGCNILKVLTTTDGREVVSLNAINEFPNIFKDDIDAATFQINYVWLGPNDFPIPDTTGSVV